jgi:hypothetical protein
MAVASSTFLLASNEFRVGTVRYWGEAVIGEDAIYLFQERRARGRSFVVLIEALADRILPVRQFLGESYAAVPEAIRNHPEWPVQRDVSCPVFVVPRAAIDFLHHKKGTLVVRFNFSGIDVAIYHGRFGGGTIRSFIKSTGWPAFWDNELVNADETLAIRRQANESVRQLGAPTLSYLIIGGGFLIGILPIYLLTLRMFDHGPLENLMFVCWIISVLLIFFGWIALRRGF